MMKILFVLLLHLISGHVGCSELIGYSGGSLYILCKNEQHGLNEKYLCKFTSNGCVNEGVTRATNNWIHQERFFLLDSQRAKFTALRIILRPLREEDAGRYQFGEAGVWNHTVNLKVKRDPCCLGPKTVIGSLGDTVTINCSYPDEFGKRTKRFFKKNQTTAAVTQVINTTETQRDRLSISEDNSSKVFSVRISDVRAEDGGVYFCGVWTKCEGFSYSSLYTEIELRVTAPGSSVTVTVCVCVTLLLIGGSMLIFYRIIHRIIQGFSSIWQVRRANLADSENDPQNNIYLNFTPNTNQSDSVYQSLNLDTNQSDSVYQSLNPKTNQSDSVYQSLNPKTNQSDSVYQSVNPNTNQSDSVYQSLNPNISPSDSVFSLNPNTSQSDSL